MLSSSLSLSGNNKSSPSSGVTSRSDLSESSSPSSSMLTVNSPTEENESPVADEKETIQQFNDRLPEAIATILTQFAAKNIEYEVPQDSPWCMFGSLKLPKVTIFDYAQRIQKIFFQNQPESESVWIHAFIYIDRCIYKHNLVLTPLNLHRIIATAFLISYKFMCDTHWDNDFAARAFGIGNKELNTLERTFFAQNFSLVVKLNDYKGYAEKLLAGYSHIRFEPPASKPLITTPNSSARIYQQLDLATTYVQRPQMDKTVSAQIGSQISSIKPSVQPSSSQYIPPPFWSIIPSSSSITPQSLAGTITSNDAVTAPYQGPYMGLPSLWDQYWTSAVRIDRDNLLKYLGK